MKFIHLIAANSILFTEAKSLSNLYPDVDLDGLNCFCSMKNMMPNPTLTQEVKNNCSNEVSTIFVDTVDDNLVSECGTSLQYLLGSCECGEEGNQIDKDRCSYNHYVATSPADKRLCTFHEKYKGCSWDGESCVWDPHTIWMLSTYDVNPASCGFLETFEECNDKVHLENFCGDLIHKGNPGNICSKIEEENCEEEEYFPANQCEWKWKNEYNSVFETCCEVDDSIIETNWDGQVFCESAGSYDYVVDGAIVFLSVLGMELNCDSITNYSLDDQNYRILYGIPVLDMAYIVEKCCVPQTSSPSIAHPSLSPSTMASSHPSTHLQPSSLPSLSPTTTLSPSSKPTFHPSLIPSQSPTTTSFTSNELSIYPTVSLFTSSKPTSRSNVSPHPTAMPSLLCFIKRLLGLLHQYPI
eukprot:CAMPEP_0178943746 /NCGR_PEP_ID=MMETSP0789-20121207/2760_1 /TAXON_ID=3005 /ORGANISM="Rhizosolenia setigera, Strain CCMP 1694" /LENGTH=410 /DNA_ID=CAMNT_0020623379 /DNA_START=308 /DNA_END=1540 /DNA_ORIENTATION=-